MEKDTYNKTLSQNLKTIRRAKGLTTVDLAKILGVSQAKISYIEHCKGVLSARDIAVLARRLDVPVTEFFRGLDKLEDGSGQSELVGQLVHYGATLLAKPSGVVLKEVPFEKVFSDALAFVEDDRIHKGFCAALITQAATKELNVDRIFSLIGNNPFLVNRAAEEAQTCIEIIKILNRSKQIISPRADRQLQKLVSTAWKIKVTGIQTIDDVKEIDKVSSIDEIGDLATFVGESLNAKR